jgi:hypothetical protein
VEQPLTVHAHAWSVTSPLDVVTPHVGHPHPVATAQPKARMDLARRVEAVERRFSSYDNSTQWHGLWMVPARARFLGAADRRRCRQSYETS